mmetsp:Transcript_10567/g.31907  ORF Transcript_10567/g.31907 Transcript_10567/m.31907 type:complete len:254 (-) Transcript_10567:510-1271(-)
MAEAETETRPVPRPPFAGAPAVMNGSEASRDQSVESTFSQNDLLTCRESERSAWRSAVSVPPLGSCTSSKPWASRQVLRRLLLAAIHRRLRSSSKSTRMRPFFLPRTDPGRNSGPSLLMRTSTRPVSGMGGAAAFAGDLAPAPLRARFPGRADADADSADPVLYRLPPRADALELSCAPARGFFAGRPPLVGSPLFPSPGRRLRLAEAAPLAPPPPCVFPDLAALVALAFGAFGRDGPTRALASWVLISAASL